ncbi:MAG: P-loop NTPase fold protein [Pseudomonadota bacterium]
MTTTATLDLAMLQKGGKGHIARALSALEEHPGDPEVARLLDEASAAAKGTVLGLTGPPGVGKSTFTNALIARIRARDQSVAVIAVDPSSRRSGGALLGDRTRIETDPEDSGVFVRSMAARNRLGGVADLTYPAAVLMRALFDWVIVETVGVGQSETEIVDCSDLVVFCAQPGSGDALQFMKAGIMEVPDVVLVTKGDMGAIARRAAADVKGALSLAADDAGSVGIAIVSAQSGDGLEEALDLIASLARKKQDAGHMNDRRSLQHRIWAESQLVQTLGNAGLSMLKNRLSRTELHFSEVSDLTNRVSVKLRAVLETL